MWSLKLRLSVATLTLLGALGLAKAPVRTQLRLDRSALTADGRSTARARVVALSALGLPAWGGAHPKVELGPRAERLGLWSATAPDGSLVIRSGNKSGEVLVRAGARSASLAIHPSLADRDRDGLPDAAELLTEADRAAFVRWFTTIAEAQATQLDDGFAKVHQDCAGLIRFSAREALKHHDQAWLAKRRYLPAIAHPDTSLHYPELPVIGARLFRARGGAFAPEEPIEAQFTAAASARALWEHNSQRVSKDIRAARAGDLLFFSVPFGTGSRMHSMIVLGSSAGATHQSPGARVVYHNGADPGEVRLVSIDALLQHPDADWHPLPHNPRFLGVHRLNLMVYENARPGALTLRGDSW